MNKKIIIAALIIITLVCVYVFSVNTIDEKLVASTIVFSATYFGDSHIIKILYLDKSNHTNTDVLEIEGLNQTFQKKYNTSYFVEDVPISFIPQYGWKSTPVTLLIDHKEFGKLILKTEITPYGQLPSKVIYSRP